MPGLVFVFPHRKSHCTGTPTNCRSEENAFFSATYSLLVCRSCDKPCSVLVVPTPDWSGDGLQNSDVAALCLGSLYDFYFQQKLVIQRRRRNFYHSVQIPGCILIRLCNQFFGFILVGGYAWPVPSMGTGSHDILIGGLSFPITKILGVQR